MKRLPFPLIASFALLFFGVLLSTPAGANNLKKSTLTGEIISASAVAPFGTNDRIILTTQVKGISADSVLYANRFPRQSR